MAAAADAILKKVPKTTRARRELKERSPKEVENVKKALVIKGPKVSEIVTSTLKDWHKLKSPDSKMFLKKNVTRPFEDQSSLEFLARMNDTSLFAFGCHAKKRPHCVVLGRLFDGQVLDMLELTINPDTFKSIKSFSDRSAVVHYASKPMFIFNGDEFDTNPDLSAARSLILDYFRGEVIPKINLAGLDRVIVCTAVGDKIFFRHYGVMLKKSDGKLPRVELDEVGPRIDFTFRRRKTASDDVVKASLKQPRVGLSAAKKKNKTTGKYGESHGKIHVGRQDLTDLSLAGLKGLRGKRKHNEDGSAKTPASGFGSVVGPKSTGKTKKSRTTSAASAPPPSSSSSSSSTGAPTV